jgi:hypothetical protein
VQKLYQVSAKKKTEEKKEEDKEEDKKEDAKDTPKDDAKDMDTTADAPLADSYPIRMFKLKNGLPHSRSSPFLAPHSLSPLLTLREIISILLQGLVCALLFLITVFGDVLLVSLDRDAHQCIYSMISVY